MAGLFSMNVGKRMSIASHIIYNIGCMWAKQCHKPAMTGNGKFRLYTIHKNGDDWGGFMLVLTTLADFMISN